jgi:hypothetical protein
MVADTAGDAQRCAAELPLGAVLPCPDRGDPGSICCTGSDGEGDTMRHVSSSKEPGDEDGGTDTDDETEAEESIATDDQADDGVSGS